jgi:hypothetical protein
MLGLLGSLLEDNSLKQQGFWDASTNTPTLANSVGVQGYYYVVSVGGTVNFGAGNITFTVGDWVYYNTANQWVKFETGVDYVPVNKAGDTMTGNLSVPKISVGTTNTPSIETVGEGLTVGLSLAGVTQTTRRTTSRIGNAELNFHNHHLHSATSWIKNLFVRSKGDTDTHVSVSSGDIIEESIYGGRFQSGATGSYYPAVSIKKKIGTGTVSGTSMPGELSIEVSPDGAIVPVEAFKINSNGSTQFYQGVNVQTGTSYTLGADDYAKLITFNNASPITVTLPQQSTTPTTTGFFGKVRNLGVGAVNFVKEGAETLDGNTTLNQFGEVLIERPTTTKWSVAYGTALKPWQVEATRVPSVPVAGTTYVLVTKAKNPFTITGFVQQATSLGTAGTYTVSINGVAITGLTTVANTTTINETAATALNSVSAGDQVTIVLTGIVAPVGWIGSLSILESL